MRAMSISAFLVTAFVVLSTARGDWAFLSHSYEASYRSNIPRDKLEALPSWTSDQENPPLPARKAIQAAERALKQLWDADNYPKTKMVLEEASLVHLDGDKWVWVVRYVEHPIAGGATGVPAHFDIVILMDGTVVAPTRLDKP
jgi:hypothetical protein